jgi:hypothetical protein
LGVTAFHRKAARLEVLARYEVATVRYANVRAPGFVFGALMGRGGS